jgi:UMP-CMP kinase
VRDRLLERGKTSGRTDDNLEAIIKRFQTYKTQTQAVINYFESLGRLRTVDTSQDISTAYSNVKKVLGLDEKK